MDIIIASPGMGKTTACQDSDSLDLDFGVTAYAGYTKVQKTEKLLYEIKSGMYRLICIHPGQIDWRLFSKAKYGPDVHIINCLPYQMGVDFDTCLMQTLAYYENFIMRESELPALTFHQYSSGALSSEIEMNMFKHMVSNRKDVVVTNYHMVVPISPACRSVYSCNRLKHCDYRTVSHLYSSDDDHVLSLGFLDMHDDVNKYRKHRAAFFDSIIENMTASVSANDFPLSNKIQTETGRYVLEFNQRKVLFSRLTDDALQPSYSTHQLIWKEIWLTSVRHSCFDVVKHGKQFDISLFVNKDIPSFDRMLLYFITALVHGDYFQWDSN